MAGRKFRLSVGVHLPFGTLEIAITTDNLFGLRIPNDELLVTIVTGVELVNVHRLACAASRFAEGNLTKSSDFLHHVRCIVGCNDVNLVMTLVRHTELALRSQLLFEDFLVYRLDNLLFHF